MRDGRRTEDEGNYFQPLPRLDFQNIYINTLISNKSINSNENIIQLRFYLHSNSILFRFWKRSEGELKSWRLRTNQYYRTLEHECMLFSGFWLDIKIAEKIELLAYTEIAGYI